MKNKKIKITINRSEPNSQEIQEMQNFEQVMQLYIQTPKSKNPGKLKWMGGTLITAAAGLLLFFYFYQKPLNTEPIIIAPAKKQKAFIQKPTAIREKTFEVFEIESGKADTILTQSGARIIVPACKFLSEGKEVNGMVQLKYREFKNPIDIALSGIPMTYDSAGKTYQFESAGMFEIQGAQANNQVQVASNCAIVVELVQTKNHPKFNAYFLDTLQKNWVNIGKPKRVVEEQVQNKYIPAQPAPVQQVEFVEESSFVTSPAKPLKPQKANETLPHFTLNFNAQEFPELTAYGNTVFEVNEADKKRSIELFSINWSNIKYKTIESGKTYLVVMELFDKRTKQLQRKEQMEVHPVIKEEDYEQAMAEFKKKDLFYRESLAKQAEERKNKQKAQLLVEKSLHERITQAPPSYSSIRNAFAVKNFGIYNSDYPVPLENVLSKTIEITDKKGNYEKVDILYQLTLNKGLFMSNYFNQNIRGKISFDPSDSTLLFTVLPDGKVAYLMPPECLQFFANKETRLVLNKTERVFRTTQEIVDYFNIKNN